MAKEKSGLLGMVQHPLGSGKVPAIAANTTTSDPKLPKVSDIKFDGLSRSFGK